MNDKLLKKQTSLFIMISFLIILLVVGITYAYFSSGVSNTNNEKINAGTATLSLVFEDNDSGVSGNLSLGQSITKKFTIENTGTVDTYAKINWYNLVNTYTANSLTYTLEQSTSENGTYEALGNGKVPTSNAETTETLKNGILVPVNTTYYYKLVITLNNLDVEQNSDINASFYSYFNLEEGSLSASDKLLELVGNADPSSTNVITGEVPANATCTNTLAYDGTTDNNLRYVGADPCNYVTFNGETAGWRMVGIMNNVDDGTGNLETRIKLIRVTSLGSYSWDTSVSGENGATSNYGINDWTQADLKNELNGDYLNTSLQANTNWYNGGSNQQTGVYDYTKGLTSSAQSLIGNAKWHLGGHNTPAATASTFYTAERGTTVYSGRPTEWTGKVALIYPSDYGYAVGGSVRSTCLGKNLTYNSDSCYTNDWLYINNTYQWLLSPNSYNAYIAFNVNDTGSVDYYIANLNYSVRPAVYLRSEVTITGGSGTETDPYELSL